MSKDDRELIELKPCPFCDGPGRIEHSYHEDDNRYPRDFWHVRASCSACGVSPTGWLSYGNQEQRVANVHVKQAAEADAIDRWNARPATRLEALQAQPVVENRLIEIANRAVEENLNPDGTTKYGAAQGYSCALSALRLAALTASPPVVEREAVIDRALVLAVEDMIDGPFSLYPIEPMEVSEYRASLYRIWSPLRDAILALTPVEGVGDVQEALRLAYVTGFNDGWQDGNGEGDAVNTVCRGDGLGDFMSGITGLDLATLTKGARDAG